MIRYSNKKSVKVLFFGVFLFLFSFLFMLSVTAAPKRGIVVSGTKTLLHSKKGAVAYIGEKKKDLDLLINGKKKTEGVRWSTKNHKILKVDKKGRITPLANGRAIVVARYKSSDFKALVEVKTKAEEIIVTEEGKKEPLDILYLHVGETKRLNIQFLLSEKVEKAGGKKASLLSVVIPMNEEMIRIEKISPEETVFSITALKSEHGFLDIYASEKEEKLNDKDSTLFTFLEVEIMEKDALKEASEESKKEVK